MWKNLEFLEERKRLETFFFEIQDKTQNVHFYQTISFIKPVSSSSYKNKQTNK